MTIDTKEPLLLQLLSYITVYVLHSIYHCCHDFLSPVLSHTTSHGLSEVGRKYGISYRFHLLKKFCSDTEWHRRRNRGLNHKLFQDGETLSRSPLERKGNKWSRYSVVELSALVRDLVFSAWNRCWSLNRDSVSYEIKNSNKWVVDMNMLRHDEVIREDKGVLDGVNLFSKSDTKKYSQE